MMVHWKEILVEEIPYRGYNIGETESFLLKDTNLELLEASQTFEDIFSENGTDEWPSTHTESDWSDTEWPDDLSDFGDEFGGEERSDELVPATRRLSENDLGSNNSFNITNIRSSNKNNSSSSSNSNNSFNITNLSSCSDNSISMNSIINNNINNINNNSNNSMIGIKVVSRK
jgi:hypothetical protein